MKHVLLSGGIFHPFDDCARWLDAAVAEQLGSEPALVTRDVEVAFDALAAAELFSLYALRWRMLNHPKYLPYMDEWAFSMTPQIARKLTDFVLGGGAMLGMHTASICFDTWPEFSQLLGGHWQWDTSFHPEHGLIEVEPVGQHPITAGIATFRVHDEVYHHLAVEPDSEPLLRARVVDPGKDSDGAWHTVAWAAEPGAGRVVYNALGHSTASLAAPMHSKFLSNAVAWLAKLANEPNRRGAL